MMIYERLNWVEDVLIVKLHTDIVHFVGYNETVHQIMNGMNNNITVQKLYIHLSK